MWRSFFLALGAYCCLLGLEALAVERAILKIDPTDPAPPSIREIAPPQWAPYIMMAAGAIVMLYSFTIPKKLNGG
jgi:hypothetical protein